MIAARKNYVEVVLPLPVAGTFTYIVPESMREQAVQGARVIVPFGRKKFYTGIVVGNAADAPMGYEVKEIIHVLDSHPVIRHPQLRFWEWMSEYYLCSLGDVYNAAIPSGLKIESETMVEANPEFEPEDASLLSEKEVHVYQLLATKGKLAAKDVEKETGFRNVPGIINGMVAKGVVIISESLVERFRPKKRKCVKIAFARGDEEAMRVAFGMVRGAKKQEAMLMTLIHLSGFTRMAEPQKEVSQEELIEKSKCTAAILKALVDKGLVERYTVVTSRFGTAAPAQLAALPQLSDAQSEALGSVHRQFLDKGVVLLHGVTGSGKTELYAHLIDYALKQRQQVLMLVPEIALTTQLTCRLKEFFGERLLVYHSKFSDNEKVEIWNRLLHTNEPHVVLGARSAVFLPFAKLGLVIVDEEHDSSYKQYDPAPRFSGRDAAIMLAYMHGAKTLLGSATPAVETYYKALSGKYGLAELSERYKGVELPQIEVVDMAQEQRKKTLKGAIASPLISAVNSTVEHGRQAILFLNRRGYSPMARCTQCQYIPKCQYCDVSLTYHKRANMLVCHYCGASYPLSDTCPVCKEPSLEIVGYGTERVEDDVDALFPNARTLRMDLDTTRNKNSYANLIDAFSEHKADILVGTQMVSKGLDFANVGLVGVVNADSLINFPDFRSAERAFNMLEQVAGRSGRTEKGRVLIQTRTPDHPVLGFVRRHDYKGFYEFEIEERRAYAYPPFSKIIMIHLKHRDERELDEIANVYAARLRELFGNRVQGPTRPAVARVQSLYIRQVMLKIELNASMQKVKEILRDLYVSMRSRMPETRSLVLYYDVDPY